MTVLYLLNALMGTALAIRDDLPGRPAGVRTGLAPSRDFVFGLGTALSPPLVLCLWQAVCAVLSGSSGRAGEVTRRMLPWNGAGFTLGMLAEPILLQTLRRPTGHPVRAATIAANVALPLLITRRGLRLACAFDVRTPMMKRPRGGSS
ncbi:MAG: hypothetical protein M3N52_10165 [Actinomycetota bacterium]|nr:hypothetical protein [Actinomycetota bacterium]